MKRLLSWTLAGLLVVAVSPPVEARPGHGGLASGGSGLCPQGTFSNPSGVSDGCPDAPAGTPNGTTLVQRSNFFSSYALQSGQTYTTRPPWNVAGVDYPVGIPTSVILKDPNAGGLPAGCTVNLTGNSLGGPILNCTEAGDLDLEGWDFTGTIAGSNGCYVIGNTYTGTAGQHTLTFKNNYLNRGTACYGNSNAGFNDQIFPGSFGTLDVENNVWDFAPPTSGPGFKPMSVGANQTMIFKYNYFHNIPENPINGGANGANFALLMAYNFVDGYTYAGTPNQNHGEVTDLNASGIRSQYYWYFNTIFHDNQSAQGTGTANIWFSAATNNGSSFIDNQAQNNTNVDNCSAAAVAGGATCGTQAASVTDVNLADFQSNTFTTEEVTDNYSDAIGAARVGRIAGGICLNTITWTGNIDLKTNTVITKVASIGSVSNDPSQVTATGSITGSVLTITAVSSGTFRVGMTIQNGITVSAGTQITSFGTGTGTTGTYNLSTTQTVGSQAMFGISGCTV